MSSNRYGQIWHGDRHHINIRFPSNEARLKFQEEFEAYHQSHDHDGDIPTFKAVTTKDLKLSTGSRTPEDMSKRDITIDGYHWSEIRSYQDNQDLSDYNWYRPPTCCVPPTIVIDSEYVSSADLKRHPLSAIFGNMPDSDFQSLLSSVESDGFIEPVIRIYEGQILDGWHRYRAAQELGIIRKLRFREWNEDSHRDGDPKVFVLARNIERRHLNASQRAQIAVTFSERFGHGGDRKSRAQNELLKTQEDLSSEANVSVSSIKRATQIEKAGRAEEVISGEKSAGEVITEETVKSLWEQINPAISAWKKEREGVGHASKSMFIKATLRFMGLPSDTETDVKVLRNLLKLLTSEIVILETLIRKQLEGNSLWGNASLDAETDEKETDPPSQTETEEREANKELKRKKQMAKLLWDTRIQAARDYTGDADSDLNRHVTLPELERGFADNNPTYALDFKLAMKCTSEQSFKIVWDKIVAADVTLEVLHNRVKAIQTYAGDIRQWERPDWSPDTNWILPLIEANKKKETDGESESDEETSQKPDKRGCKRELQRLFEFHGTLEPENAGDEDIVSFDLHKKHYNLDEGAVRALMAEVTAENAVHYQQTLETLKKFELKLKALVVSNELVCDTLHFYYGIERTELPSTSPEELIKINEFIEGFIDKPVAGWPEWLRNQVPKREIECVSIVIRNDTDDEIELVEFTDETSDEIWGKLDEMPYALRSALFSLAMTKIASNYAAEENE